MNKKLSAHLETGRISNLPTVWSNIFMAWALYGPFVKDSVLLLYLISGSLFYVGGCYLGDAKDVDFDVKNKPSRPIPSGIITEKTIWFMGIIMVTLGLFISGFLLKSSFSTLLLGPGLLSLVIVSYALLHKKSPLLGLPLIGCCRLLLVCSSFLIVSELHPSLLDSHPIEYGSLLFISIPIAVGIYTICFASVARLESSERKAKAPQILKFIMLLLPCVILPMIQDSKLIASMFIPAYSLYAIWLLVAFKQIHSNKGAYVSKCLAGFALLDLVLISPTGYINMAICLVLFAFALILQKIAPAT